MTGNKGFSLIEIIVAASIFAIVVASASSLFVVGIRGQRNAVSQKDLLDNLRFAMEVMTRQLRMAQQDGQGGACTGVARATYGGGGSTMSFIDYNRNCVTYRLDNGKIQARKGGGQFNDITSNDINITTLDFKLQGELVYDNEQPRVTIYIEAEDPNNSEANIKLQTMISGRNLDVP